MSLSQIWGNFVLGEHHRENPHYPDQPGIIRSCDSVWSNSIGVWTFHLPP
ncbi:hypothetical protein M422DRAFT_248314 [Sphaerobolus stellatus SS14]|uniref:Uncharacterized protein n=1 Tax=Sphaerobolus stellatus (strain SS14) TaxID=990650 RepID=A0A0C9W531_SPHS4|nr:hypothetical protein M422DRAFT_248314 [Sphaerobolus stellatus SS14]